MLHVNIKKKNQHFNKMKIPNALDVITFPSTVNAKKSVRELVGFPFSFPDTGLLIKIRIFCLYSRISPSKISLSLYIIYGIKQHFHLSFTLVQWFFINTRNYTADFCIHRQTIGYRIARPVRFQIIEKINWIPNNNIISPDKRIPQWS